MTKHELRRTFIAFVGEDRFVKFWQNIQWLSLNDFRVRAWQELLVEKFQAAHPGLGAADILGAITDETRFIYACPTLGCSFIACCENAYPVEFQSAEWSCPECAITWKNTALLHKNIREAVARFPYRAGCYEEGAGGIVPAPRTSWATNYEERVASELGADVVQPTVQADGPASGGSSA